MEMRHELYLGIDLGGSSAKIGLISADGRFISYDRVVTKGVSSYEVVLNHIAKSIDNLIVNNEITWSDIKGIGIGIPGFLDYKNGVVIEAPNLGWENVPIKKLLEERFRLPVRMDNDANIAVLGEFWLGKGKGYKHIVLVTIGTGIGAGIMVDGKILHGKNGMAAELGHIPIAEEGIICRCGKINCLETVSSAAGILRKGKEMINAGTESVLTEWYADKINQISASNIIDLAKKGDKESINIIDDAGKLLGKGIAIVANLFDPEIIIIGGGLSLAGDVLINPIKKGFYENGLDNIVKEINIVPAELGNKAGMLGAALLFKN